MHHVHAGACGETVKIATVWPIPLHAGALVYGAHIGTSCLHNVYPMGLLHWPSDGEPPPEVRDYDVLIVNLFAAMRHVTQIKAVHPNALVIALPDGYFDDVFRQGNPHGALFLEQLQAADAIGYVSDSNRRFYAALTGKQMVYIPHPIGTDDYFANMRRQVKDDFILTLDHAEQAGVRPLDYTAPNIAAVAALQRETGLHVVYVNAGEETRDYARRVGLRAEFHRYMVYHDFVQLAARARLGVDMYALHGFGRNEITLAYAGTPCVGSTTTSELPFRLKVSPWDGLGAARLASNLLRNDTLYTLARNENLAFVEAHYSFDAVRRQMMDTMKQVATWRLPSSS